MSIEKFVAIPDNHGALIHKKSKKILLDFIKEFKPKHRIHLGDNWDFGNLRRGADPKEEGDDMTEDWYAGLNFLNELKPTVYMSGNHSFSKKTELLTEQGWKSISEITLEDVVAQFDINSREISYDKPIDLESHYEDKLISIEGRFSKQIVTNLHDVVIDHEKIKAKDCFNIDLTSHQLPSSGFYNTQTSEDLDWLRFITWVICDGCLVDCSRFEKNKNSNKRRIQFKISKPRKIERLKALLDNINIKYTFALCKKGGLNKLQPFYIRIYGDTARDIFKYLNNKKEFPDHWKNLNRECLDAIIEELSHTDGSKSWSGYSWTTTNKRDFDIISELCIKNDVLFRFKETDSKASGFKNAKIQYHAFIYYRTYNLPAKIEWIDYRDTVYCITMPFGTVISRIDGKIAFTGNCHRLWKAAEDHRGVVRAYAEQGISEIMSKLKSLNCQFYPYHFRKGVHKLGDLSFLHGYSAGENAVRQHAQVYGNCIIGHLHRIESSTARRLESAKCMTIGCLANFEEMNYAAQRTATMQWRRGFAYGIINTKTGKTVTYQAEEIDGCWIYTEGIKVL